MPRRLVKMIVLSLAETREAYIRGKGGVWYFWLKAVICFEPPRLLATGPTQKNAYLSTMTQTNDTAVLYNAECPVCNFEISHYAKYAETQGLPIRFDDLNTSAREAWDLTEDQAARRLYVVHEGALTSGIPAFLVLWAQMPKYRWLGQVVGLPGIKQVAGFTYDWVLAPAIYRWHLARKRRAARAA